MLEIKEKKLKEKWTRENGIDKLVKVEREYTHFFEKTDYHCLDCGEKDVWTEPNSEVDYGGGDYHICVSCGYSFYGWTSPVRDIDIAQKLRDAQ